MLIVSQLDSAELGGRYFLLTELLLPNMVKVLEEPQVSGHRETSSEELLYCLITITILYLKYSVDLRVKAFEWQ